MTTPTSAAQPSTDVRFEAQLEEHLAGHLPGLSDSDLADLAIQVRTELEDRVGTVLSAGLTEAQLSEFETLMAGDDNGDACATWLATARPNYRAVVAVECARLIADVVEKVTAADPGTVQGVRRVGQIVPFSMDLVEQHLKTRELKYLRQPDDSVEVGFAADDAGPGIVIRVNRVGANGELFTFTGTAPDQTYSAESARALRDYASDWNARTWMPKAVVSVSEDTGNCRIIAEVAIPVGGPVNRTNVDAMVIRCFGSIFRLFSSVRDEFSESAPQESRVSRERDRRKSESRPIG